MQSLQLFYQYKAVHVCVCVGLCICVVCVHLSFIILHISHSISHWLPCPVPSWVPNIIGTWRGNSGKYNNVVLYNRRHAYPLGSTCMYPNVKRSKRAEELM